MPRLLRRAAVLGTTAHVASSRGAAKAEQEAAAAQAAPPPPPVEQQAAPVAAPAPAAADHFDELMKLKQLLDAGVLTEAEFDSEKQKLLGA